MLLAGPRTAAISLLPRHGEGEVNTRIVAYGPSWGLAALVVLALASPAWAAAAKTRTWTDNQGRTMTAQFVRVFEGQVILSRGNKPLRVPFYSLSEDDQEYVKEQLTAKGQAHLIPPPPPKVEQAGPEGNRGSPDGPPGMSRPPMGMPPGASAPSMPPRSNPFSDINRDLQRMQEDTRRRQEEESRRRQEEESRRRQEESQRRQEESRREQQEMQASMSPPSLSPPSMPTMPSRPFPDRPMAGPSGPGPMMTAFECGKCGREVPNAKPGDKCPRCGVQWDYVETADGQYKDRFGNIHSGTWVKMGGGVGVIGGLVGPIIFLIRAFNR